MNKLLRAGTAGVIILSLIMPAPGVLLAPARAMQDPTVVNPPPPPLLGKDSQRLKLYLSVINGYLQQIKELCDKSGGAGREYIAYRTRDIPPPPVTELGPAYATYKQELDRAETDFRKDAIGLDGGPAQIYFPGTREEGGEHSPLFQAQKSAESKYHTSRTKEQVKASARYLKALQEQYRKMLEALKKYCDANYRYYRKVLAWDSAHPAPQFLFGIAEAGSRYCFLLTRVIPAYKAGLYQNKYARDNEFYAAYERYADSLYKLHINYLDPPSKETGKRLRSGLYSYYREEPLERPSERHIDSPFIVSNTAYDSAGISAFFNEKWQRAIAGQRLRQQNAFFLKKEEALNKLMDELNEITSYKYLETVRDHKFNSVDTKRQDEQAVERLAFVLRAMPDLLAGKISFPPNANGADYFHPYYWEYYDYTHLSTRKAGCGPCHPWVICNRRPGVGPRQGIARFSPGEFDLGKARAGGAATLNAPGEIFDPDEDSLNYRWIINRMPESAQARSTKYALGQEVGRGKSLVFEPDLAGEWEFALLVNDGVNELLTSIGGANVDYALLRVTAFRHILWIEHSDGPYDPQTGLGIELKLYDPKAQWGSPLHPEQGPTRSQFTYWGRPYYLEAAHQRSGLYLNYADNGQPVDPDPYQKESNAAGEFELRGFSYNGDYGSTNLSSAPVKYRAGEEFTLVSSSFGRQSAEINVIVQDPQVTDLVLPMADGSYHPVPAQGTGLGLYFCGSYLVKQEVDHYSWVNDRGTGFVAVAGANGAPDWLERRAAEVLNKFPEVLGDVKAIKVFSKTDNPNYYGYAPVQGFSIHIRKDYSHIRYNLPDLSGYARTGMALYCGLLDHITRHEAWHKWYSHCGFWSDRVFNNPKLLNTDRDMYPGEDGGPASGISGKMIEYSLDSPANNFGPENKKDEYAYKGDKVADLFSEKKFMTQPYPLRELLGPGIMIYPNILPNFYYTFRPDWLVIIRAGGGKIKLPLLVRRVSDGGRGDVNFVDASLMNRPPAVSLVLNSDFLLLWREFLGLEDVDEAYILYTMLSTYPYGELDADRVGGIRLL